MPIEGRSRDNERGSAWGCGFGEILRARPSREVQNVRVTARTGTPGHSIVAPSLLIVFTKVARKLVARVIQYTPVGCNRGQPAGGVIVGGDDT